MKLKLSTQKNLLAFSGGVDSTALFFILLENNIPFDIAIVNYNVREQSKQEVAYALSLALKYKKQCFVEEVTLENESNFEKKARDIRYDFFEELIEEYQYETLLTAHQLNDKLEWFLMQLGKGAGLCELLGLEASLKKKNYTIVRPLLDYSKEELEEYLISSNHKYFYDQSNSELTYKRNYIRHEFAHKFLNEFQTGVRNSFKYLQKDLESLHINYEAVFKEKELEIFDHIQDKNLTIRIIDAALKQRGYLLSHAQRNEIFKQKECVIDRFAIALTPHYIWIAPVSSIKMDKSFKEQCRIMSIPKKIRAYLFEKSIELEKLAVF